MTEDRALYIRIKLQHPEWSDELVGKEIERLQSEEFAKLYRDIYRNVLRLRKERLKNK